MEEERSAKRQKRDDERDIVDILSLNVVLYLITFFDISELLKFFYLSKWCRSLMYNETCSNMFKHGIHQLIERLNEMCVVKQDDTWMSIACSQPTFYLQMEYVKDIQRVNQLRCVSDDDKLYLIDRIGYPINPDNVGERETYYRSTNSGEFRKILITVNREVLDTPMTMIRYPLQISGTDRLFLCSDLNLYIKNRGFYTVFFRREYPDTKLSTNKTDFDIFEIEEQVEVKQIDSGIKTIRVIFDYKLGVIRSCVFSDNVVNICDTIIVNISECIKEDDLKSYFNIFKGDYCSINEDMVILFIRKIDGHTKYYAFFRSRLLKMTITHINLQVFNITLF